MREMKDSGVEWIDVIPTEWSIVPLKTEVMFGKGLPITKENLIENGVAVVSYGQIHSKNNAGSHLREELVRHVSEEYLQTNPNCLAKKGDIFVADTSEDYDGIGNAVLIDWDSAVFAGYHTVIIRPINRRNSKYFSYLFMTDAWRSQLRSRASGIKVFSVTQGLLKKTAIIVPDEKRIRNITDYLDSKCALIDSIISKQEQIIEKLKEYKLSVINEIVTKGLDSNAKQKKSGIDWLGTIPSHWKIGKLNKCIKTIKGFAFKSEAFRNEGIPVVRVSEIKDGTVNDTSVFIDSIKPEYEQVLLHEGDILMTTVGSHPRVINSAVGQLGRVPVAMDNSLLNQNAVCLRTIGVVNKDFIYYYLSTKRYREHLNLIAHGTANQYSISLSDVLDFEVLIPPIDEQKQIAIKLNDFCERIKNSIIKRHELILKLEQYKKSLIYEIVTGKKEV